MAEDIFKQESNIQGSWSMDHAIVQFNSGKGEAAGAAELIATGLQIRYSRQITPFRPINVNGTYLVGGRGIGQMTIQALVGPSSTIDKWLEQYGDICNATGETNGMTINPGGLSECANGARTTKSTLAFQCDGCALQEISLGVQQIGELSVVNTALSLIFTSLSVAPGKKGNIAASAADAAAAAALADQVNTPLF